MENPFTLRLVLLPPPDNYVHIRIYRVAKIGKEVHVNECWGEMGKISCKDAETKNILQGLKNGTKYRAAKVHELYYLPINSLRVHP